MTDDSDERKMLSISFFCDTEEEMAQVLEILSRPITALVLEGKAVHISIPDEDVKK